MDAVDVTTAAPIVDTLPEAAAGAAAVSAAAPVVAEVPATNRPLVAAPVD